ncbi:MAG: PEGA domain-containing protein [Deltaproteobacteria bacterium]|nr:PEGA domain-containing protein [Deltaproteobacteria bacterium]
MRSCCLIFALALLAGQARGQAAKPAPRCTGWIQVETPGVEGASVILDGKQVPETTPATIKDVPCGRHAIRVEKRLYKRARQRVRVKLGEVSTVRIRLVEDFGFLTVRSVPPEAVIKLDGQVAGKSPLEGLVVPAGRHVLAAELPHHSPARERIRIRPGQRKDLTLRPRLNVALLDVTTRPAGAEVLLDGKKLGPGPIEKTRIAAGRHSLRVELGDHDPIERRFRIRRGQALSFDLVPEPLFGRLELHSEPEPHCPVLLDGDPLGPAPLVLERVPVGEHELRVECPRFAVFQRRVRIQAGKSVRVAAKLTPRTARLSVWTEPPDCFVWVDGWDLGPAPVSVEMEPGRYELRAGACERQGEELGFAATRIRLEPGKHLEMDVEVPRKPGRLLIKTEPPGARVLVDGRKRGKAPVDLELPAGAHAIEARQGKKSLLGRIELRSGQVSKVGLDLDRPGRSVFIEPTEPEIASLLEPGEKLRGSDQDRLDGNGAVTDVSARAAAPMSTRRVFAWISASAAGASAAAAVGCLVAGAVTESDANEAYSEYLQNQTTENRLRYEDLDRKSSDLYLAGWIMVGAAAGVGALSVYLFLSEPEPEVDLSGPAEGPRAAPLPGGGWIGYQGRF